MLALGCIDCWRRAMDRTGEMEEGKDSQEAEGGQL